MPLLELKSHLTEYDPVLFLAAAAVLRRVFAALQFTRTDMEIPLPISHTNGRIFNNR